ncbi:MAG: citrate synthase/methylcitrate synthase [Thermoleophilia bacterium]
MKTSTNNRPDTTNVGLRGITVADTKISDVNGEEGRIVYRGYDINTLAARSDFEEVVFLLLYGDLPLDTEYGRLHHRLGERRRIPDETLDLVRRYPKDLRPMDFLQASVPLLKMGDPRPEDSKDVVRERSVDLTAKMATLVAAYHRLRIGEEPIPADPDLDHAADFLRMLTGEMPDPEVAHVLDVALLLHADHSMNASTFVARAVTSTRAHTYSAVAAAIGALSGELHGGANSRVMEMLLEIGSPERVEEYIRAKLEAGEKIMGMGHRVYKTYDPRALILQELIRQLGDNHDLRWLEMTKVVEETTRRLLREIKGKEIYPNVDLYSASLYYMMGIPIDLFTPVFAMSRVAGWCAHIIEERFAEAAEKPALYRPLARYVGHYCGPEECTYEPMAKRHH